MQIKHEITYDEFKELLNDGTIDPVTEILPTIPSMGTGYCSIYMALQNIVHDGLLEILIGAYLYLDVERQIILVPENGPSTEIHLV